MGSGWDATGGMGWREEGCPSKSGVLKEGACCRVCGRRRATNLNPALFELDFARVHVTSILQLGDLRLCGDAVVELCVLALNLQLLLELLIVSLELVNGRAACSERRKG